MKRFGTILIFLAFAAAGTFAQVDVTATGGVNASYTTLKAAFDAINAGTHTGTITIGISADATETATAVLNASGSGAASYTSITISPTGGAARTISGAITAGSPLIDMNGADNVTFDGLNTGGNSLTISNTTASATSGTCTFRFIGGATNNTITNCTVLGSFSASVATNGGNIFFSTDAVTTNGNDNNTVSNCNLGPAGANLPTKCVYSNGSTTTTAINNSGIVINNNNIFDYFGAAVTSSGVYIAGGSTDINITNNKFYQTATRTQTTGAQHSAIWIANSSGNNFLISGNTIGFASNTGTGTYNFVAVSSSSVLIPIFLNVGTTTATSVQGNTIAGIAMSGAGSGTSSSAAFRGIYVSGGLTTIGDVTGNTIGSQSATGSITFTSSSTSAADVIGIYNFGSSNWTTNNNTVGGITASNSSTGAANVYGLRCFTTSSVTWTCLNNTIGGSVANSIQSTTTATGSTVQGILNSSPAATMTGNVIRNLTAAGGTGTTTSASVIGISSSASSANHTISQNTIHTLTNTNTSAATTITGIQYTSSTGANVIERNFIHSLSGASTSAIINGIQVSGGVATYRNNMIRLGVDASGGDIATALTIVGINKATTSNNNFFFNSVYIGGTGVGSATAGTYAFRRTSTGTDTVANNIFVNARSNATTGGKHFADSLNASTTFVSNSNVYYVSGTGGVFGSVAGTDYATLAAWKSGTGLDANSVHADPQFINPTGTSSTVDLHIHATNPTPIEANGGIFGTSALITDDFDGQTRSSFTPIDIGADAGNFVGLDLVGPSISYTLLGNISSTANRSFTGVTITDASGVNGTSGTRPRVYYKRSTDANAFNDNTSGTDGWKYAEASGASSPFSFTINYALLNGGTGVTTGDIVQYFVVAQDLATTPNVAINSGSFAAQPSSVNLTGAAFPIGGTINSYAIANAFSGSYNVGSGQTYTTLTGAGGFFAAINAGVATGNITVTIISDMTEDGTNALNQWSEEGAGSYTLTISPDGTTERLISGAVANGLIRLNGADRVTIDGRFSGSGKYLRFRNTNTSNPTFTFINDATNNTIRDCYIEGANSSTTSGTILFSTSTGTSGNSNNTIMNCDIRDRSDAAGVPANAVYSSGTSGAPNANNTISSCNIFNWTSSGVLVSSTGAGNGWTINPSSFYQTASRTTGLTVISIQGGSGHTISGNSIGGSAADRSGDPLTTTGTFTGITLAAGTTATSNIQGNVLANINVSGGSTQTFKGIQVTGGNVNVGTTAGNVIGSTSDTPGSDTVRVNYDTDLIDNSGSGTVAISNNTIRHVAYYRNSNDRLLGIGSSSGTVTISNNTIRNLKSNASASTTFFLMGLRVTGGTSATVTGNTIRNLSQINTGSGAFWVSGIQVTTITNASLSRNTITEINASGSGTSTSAPLVRGIHSTSGSATFSNNMVSVGDASGGDIIVRGIESLGTGSNKFYFNSVVVSGADGSTGTNKTYAFYRSSTATDTLRNNIFSNQRTVGTGIHFAIGNSSATNWGPNTSNYNDLLASAASTVGEWITTAGTFSDWQTNSGGDANSLSYPVTFVNTVTDLHLNALHNGDQNLKGTPAGGITVDFDNQTRDPQAPYIGADELSTPLPIQLASFTARINTNGPGVRLDWRTISEINNFGFYVQRKRQGETAFTELQNSFVPGHGTTNEPHDYSYIDASLTQTGLYFYRLRQVDLDGTPHFTDPITINVTTLSVDEVAPKVFALFQNYPNPFNPSTQIKFSVENTARATLELYNMLGQKVATLFDELAEAGKYYRVNLNANNLATGMYIYRLQSGTRTDVKKMLLMK